MEEKERAGEFHNLPDAQPVISKQAPVVQPEEPAEPAPSIQPEESAEPTPSIQQEEVSEEAPTVQSAEPAEPDPNTQPEEASEQTPSIQQEDPSEEAAAVQPEKPMEPAPAVQPESPAQQVSSQQETKRKLFAPRPRTQILTIQKKKKNKAAPAAVDGKKGRRLRHEVVEKNDIRYRGPLSYRHMMIFGWLCVVLSQASLLLGTAGKLDPSVARDFSGLITVGSFAAPFFMPFLLLANFSKILSSRQDFKSPLLKYGGLSLAMGLAMPVVYEHYITGLADAADRLSPGLGDQFLLFIESQLFQNGYLAYNIFIDLFLCTLFLFFLTYLFKRPVKRGWVICFRLLAILPVAYELTSIVLKTLCKNGNITLPMYVSPFLTTKPPMMFAAFIALALFIKRRETIFLRNGRSYVEYGQFLETNTNSLDFSVHASVTFIVAAVLDLVIFIVFIVGLSTGNLLMSGELTEETLENEEMLTSVAYQTAYVAEAAGFGESLVLFYFAPLVLLYSYNKKHRNAGMDIMIPMFAIAAIALLYLEGFFQAACQLPDMLNMYLQSTFGMSFAEIIDFEELQQLMVMMTMN